MLLVVASIWQPGFGWVEIILSCMKVTLPMEFVMKWRASLHSGSLKASIRYGNQHCVTFKSPKVLCLCVPVPFNLKAQGKWVLPRINFPHFSPSNLSLGKVKFLNRPSSLMCVLEVYWQFTVLDRSFGLTGCWEEGKVAVHGNKQTPLGCQPLHRILRGVGSLSRVCLSLEKAQYRFQIWQSLLLCAWT